MTETSSLVAGSDDGPVRDDSGGLAGIIAGVLLLAIVIAGIVGFIRARRR